ncbi:OadG family protein [Caloramator sp. mosi_1]|uniref:OadG family protein n=1 Tax=Caloramator sp. mosi_1 TaxID=3023090 RepID=UPI003FCE8D79
MGINTTIIAMLIVFLVLIFLGFIIKIISLFVEKMNFKSHKSDTSTNKRMCLFLKASLLKGKQVAN